MVAMSSSLNVSAWAPLGWAAGAGLTAASRAGFATLPVLVCCERSLVESAMRDSPFGLRGRPVVGRRLDEFAPSASAGRSALPDIHVFKYGEEIVRDAFLNDILVELPQAASDWILPPTGNARVHWRFAGVVAPIVSAPVSLFSHTFQLLIAERVPHSRHKTQRQHVGSAIN